MLTLEKFSWAPGIDLTGKDRLITLSSASRHYGSPRTYTVKRPREEAVVYPDASISSQRQIWYRNINLFPFRARRLRAPLGSTNPRLMNIVEEPLPFRWSRFITTLRCYSFQDSYSNAVHRISRPYFYPRTTPPYQITLLCSEVSVTDLAPSIFGAHNLDW